MLRKLIRRFSDPVPPGLYILNFLVQRIFRINGGIAWQVHYTSRVFGSVEIGDNVWKSFALSGGCYVQGNNGITIGDNTIFAPGVKIISANHRQDDHGGWDSAEPVRIGRRCWIGANAVVLPGVSLGDDVIVGAGAVVTKSFPSGSVIAGVPAKLVARNAPPADSEQPGARPPR